MLSYESNKAMAEVETAEARIETRKAASPDRRGLRRGTRIAVMVLGCAGFAFLIVSGIRSRLEGEKRLEANVKSSAIPVVTMIAAS